MQVVNGPSHPGAVGNPPSSITPTPPHVQGLGSSTPSGWMDVLSKQGPEKWAQAVRQHKGVLITDTTMYVSPGNFSECTLINVLQAMQFCISMY